MEMEKTSLRTKNTGIFKIMGKHAHVEKFFFFCEKLSLKINLKNFLF